MITKWECERCGAKGGVRHTVHAEAWGVYADIVEQHARKGKPLGCDTGSTRVRVRIPLPLSACRVTPK